MDGEIGETTIVYNMKRDSKKETQKKEQRKRKERKKLKKYNSKKEEPYTLDHTTKG